ncbi:DsbA family protein [Streptomyces sp. NPDC059837]|uniref:DsbA family oxidoreductase n=1 Tax=Streptomyces sp. NPDC059837 TaxID=3346968 RepID=UPI00364BBBDB
MEWTCLHRPNVVDAFIDALFVAHFALGEDLGDRATVDRHATGAGIDPDALDRAFADGSALRDLHRMEAPGAEFGVRAKPSWLVAGRWSRVCCPLPGSRSWRRTGYGTNEGLPGDIPWWRDAACSCWTSRCINAVGTPTGSSRCSRVRPS